MIKSTSDSWALESSTVKLILTGWRLLFERLVHLQASFSACGAHVSAKVVFAGDPTYIYRVLFCFSLTQTRPSREKDDPAHMVRSLIKCIGKKTMKQLDIDVSPPAFS